MLDMAVSSNTLRPYWKRLLRSLRAIAIDNMHHSASSLMWLIERGIRVSRLQMKDDAWRVPGCDISLLQTIDLVHLGFDGCRSVTDRCRCNVLERRREVVSSEHLSGCNKVADIGASASGHGCGKLQSINLVGCSKVTDVGIIAVGHGCSRLQSIILDRCDLVTDVGVSALGHGCGQLQCIYLGGCYQMTDVGISALGHGCGQLQTIKLDRCYLVTDVGISALGHGCSHCRASNLMAAT